MEGLAVLVLDDSCFFVSCRLSAGVRTLLYSNVGYEFGNSTRMDQTQTDRGCGLIAGFYSSLVCLLRPDFGYIQ